MEFPNTIWVQSQEIQRALDLLHYFYPVALIIIFLAGVMIYSIRTAPEEVSATPPPQKGPGGKPLPRSKKPKKSRRSFTQDFSSASKALFNWFTVGIILTFLADAVLICIHALVDRKDQWWCGKPVAVRI